jgi:hypothetical protein
MRTFSRFAVIDWSGEAVPRPKGLALAIASAGDAAPEIVAPPENRWSRQAILEWLIAHADADMLIGLDLSPALPFADLNAYFPDWPDSPGSAKALWRLVDELSEASSHLGANGFLTHSVAREHFLHQTHRGSAFAPQNGRLRRCETRQRDMKLSPASCFKLIGANQVGKSSLTGMRVLNRLAGRIPVWPFDPVPDRGPLIVEIYTSLAAREAKMRAGTSKIRDGASLDIALAALGTAPHGPLDHYDDHLTDAILTTAWLRKAASRANLWTPDGMDEIAETEGWTFGVA